MSSQRHSTKSASCSKSLTVPELEQSKITVLNMLASAHSRRSYKHAIESSSPGIVLSLDWASTVPSWCDTGRSLRGALCPDGGLPFNYFFGNTACRLLLAE